MTIVEGLFGTLFGTSQMRAHFDDRALVQSWLDVEAGLARAEANVGLIDQAVADEIAAKAQVDLLDLGAIEEQMVRAEHPLVPTIWALGELCDGAAGGFVHWGATTQDVMDTGMVLQVRQALTLVEQRLAELQDCVAELTARERDTLMAGRTHGQQALPITFGLKSASWLDELLRHTERLEQLRHRVLAGELAGASGTLASLGEQATAVRREFCKVLDLREPTIGWHVARDSLAELAADLAMIAGTCERIVGEVILLQKTEVAEAFERHDDGNVGSSTMPHKRNPMTAESVVAAARLVRRTTITALEGMVGQHERDMGPWQAEWAWIPEMFILLDATLVQTFDVVSGLVIDRERMRANLDMTDGLLMAERIMIEAGRRIGRQAAHDRIHALGMRAVEQNERFAVLLAGDDEILAALGGPERLQELLDPSTYLGATQEFIDATLAAHGRVDDALSS